ncbi:MAG: filamentous hemagglutinin N-terminal domain-containing protein [Verrucomicrobiales bacterium]|nr:filamentous hemagglutinin N-terminal domain-containing protein [Verrucomicrobiales bacterium]
MKRLVAPFLLAAYLAFGGFLLFQIANPKPHVIHVNSHRAIINVTGEDWESWLEGDGVKLLAPDENSKILIRVISDDPVRLSGKLTANGKVHVIAPNGVVVGKGAKIDLPEPVTLSSLDLSEDRSALDSATGERDFPIRAEVAKNGNVYALAIVEGGAIQASKPPAENRSNIYRIEKADQAPDLQSLKIQDQD